MGSTKNTNNIPAKWGRYVPLKIALCLCVVVFSLLGRYDIFEPSAKQRPRVTLRLAEGLDKDNPVTQAMYDFAELVSQKTKGQLQIKVYPSGQLGQQLETLEQTGLGIIDLTRTNSVVVANINKPVGVLTLPYIFRDENHKYAVLDGDIGQDIRTSLHANGLMSFEFLESGERSFYTRPNLPVRQLADLNNLKIRVQPSPVMIRMIELLGAIPTPMNYGEVYSALQTGVIDGAENDYISYQKSAHFEVAPNFLEDRHLSPPAMLVMNRQKYLSLSEPFQKVLREAAREVILTQRHNMRQANLLAKQELLKQGVTFTAVDDTEFRRAVNPIYNEFPEFTKLIERIERIE